MFPTILDYLKFDPMIHSGPGSRFVFFRVAVTAHSLFTTFSLFSLKILAFDYSYYIQCKTNQYKHNHYICDSLNSTVLPILYTLPAM